MAYYDALIAAWNGATQPPSGATGTPITGGMTTTQKIAAVNSWNVTGAIPTNFFTSGAEVLNCINYAEFKALTAAQQTNLLAMLSIPGPLLGGSANTSIITLGMILDLFTAVGPTRIALAALAKAVTLTWCKTNGYPDAQKGGGGITQIDATAAGLV